jgi:hypothetical protein
MKLRHLESIDIRQTVDDAPADTQIWRALTKPAPALQGPWAEAPAPRQLRLIEMTYLVFFKCRKSRRARWVWHIWGHDSRNLLGLEECLGRRARNDAHARDFHVR